MEAIEAPAIATVTGPRIVALQAGSPGCQVSRKRTQCAKEVCIQKDSLRKNGIRGAIGATIRMLIPVITRRLTAK